MKIKELKKWLEAQKIDPDIYSINGYEFPDEAHCLRKINEGYEVYYSERGHKNNRKIFADEIEACEYFKEKIIYEIKVFGDRVLKKPRGLF